MVVCGAMEAVQDGTPEVMRMALYKRMVLDERMVLSKRMVLYKRKEHQHQPRIRLNLTQSSLRRLTVHRAL